MTTIRKLIQVARRRGVTFERRGDRLSVIGLGRLSKKQQTAIRASRSKILKHLPPPTELAKLSDDDMVALNFSKLSNGRWTHNSGDEAGAAILALPRETLRTMIQAGTERLDQDMVAAGLKLPPIERIKLTPGRHPGEKKFVIERGKRYFSI